VLVISLLELNQSGRHSGTECLWRGTSAEQSNADLTAERTRLTSSEQMKVESLGAHLERRLRQIDSCADKLGPHRGWAIRPSFNDSQNRHFDY
jgi:hypothetical protein